MESEKTHKIVKCLECKNTFSYYHSKYRPFCSERCKMIDLGRWFAEEYAIATASGSHETQDEEDEDMTFIQ